MAEARPASASSSADVDVAIVGAGLAGLSAATALIAAGRTVKIFEASDGVGGRVRTDIHEGFVLDRGFQVLLSAYPEAQRLLDYSALNLASFVPGALVQYDGARSLVADPLRNPLSVLQTVKAPVGSLVDKLRVAKLRFDVQRGAPEDLWKRPETTVAQYLSALGFSAQIIDRFLRPLFAGITLDPELAESSRLFNYFFRMLGQGGNVVPALGMQRIPEQLAAGLPAGTVRLHARVASVDRHTITLESGDRVSARAVVVATEGPHAASLLGGSVENPGSQAVSCVYFSANADPVGSAATVLNGDGAGAGPVNNLAVLSNVSAAYAPKGRHLISAAVIGARPGFDPANGIAAIDADHALVDQVRTQLTGWFGAQVKGWDHLRTYHIAHAQPAVMSLEPAERPVTTEAGIFVAGDHRDQASIQGALRSGTRVSAAVLESLG